MKKLPIWKQSFMEIRNKENNYVYIDKTKYIYDLIDKKAPYFLSRPRRFWKSLLIDTIRCLFEWKKELFEWLYIYDKWDFEKTYPVIKLIFGNWFINSKEKLEEVLHESIKENSLNNNLDEKLYPSKIGFPYSPSLFSLFTLSLWERVGVRALKTNLCLVYLLKKVQILNSKNL